MSLSLLFEHERVLYLLACFESRRHLLLNIYDHAVLVPVTIEILHLHESVRCLVYLDARHHLLHLSWLLDAVSLLLNTLERLRQLGVLLEHLTKPALCQSQVLLRLLVLFVDGVDSCFGLLQELLEAYSVAHELVDLPITLLDLGR